MKPENPFTPRGTLNREQMERYLRGELSPIEQHDVESRMEADPLLRDAVDGMRIPGAFKGLDALRDARPASSVPGAKPWIIAGISLVAVVAAFLVIREPESSAGAYVPVLVAEPVVVPVTPAEQAAFTQEIAQATALPESLMSAFRGEDHFVAPVDTTTDLVREAPPAHVDARPVEPLQAPPIQAEKPNAVRTPKPQRKLMFFFGLKLVHPKELYPIDPVLELANGSVDARFSDAGAQVEARPVDHAVPYDRYFKTAMSRFSRGDRQGCLEDLFVVLDEYPDDVNALFYAGLCCYDLGLFPRAAGLLERARQHEVDTFIEEAEWYHALAVDRASGRETALPLLTAVVERGGFYAQRASDHLMAGH